jgi:hypothetical protein
VLQQTNFWIRINKLKTKRTKSSIPELFFDEKSYKTSRAKSNLFAEILSKISTLFHNRWIWYPNLGFLEVNKLLSINMSPVLGGVGQLSIISTLLHKNLEKRFKELNDIFLI